ncbi:hypothetical protein OGAPHI_006231 [Ogataea philodendri]|uniref:Uncharacterized protein n=1 Tax=Ogataea philodendri TaxID=1378263 RepID=A0A9P8NYW8_9ASCO|nr:uncharacterized protein OGAPHI_006231 [Ogataea philodendri]KAH3662050.1 hypothetical protein OGAPHI_006231 [Ogataea philodendri]
MKCTWISAPLEIISKDKFQGWCIPIQNKSEIPLLIAKLHEENPSIRKATHPAMYAWKTATTAPKPPHILDLDQGKHDGGERGSGERLISPLANRLHRQSSTQDGQIKKLSCSRTSKRILLSKLPSAQLFEHLTVDNFLAVVRLVPSPHVLNELLVLWLGWVQFGERVRFPIWSNIESWNSILASDKESTNNTVVVVLSVNNGRTKQVFGGSGQSVEETSNQVVRHESQGQLIIVLVSDSPQRPFLRVPELVPEVWQSTSSGVLVGVFSLPLVKCLKWLGSQLDVLEEPVQVLSGGNSLPPSGNVWVFGSPFVTVKNSEWSVEHGSKEDVGNGKSLTNQEGVVLESGIQSGNNLLQSSKSIVNDFLVVWSLSEEWLESSCGLHHEFGRSKGDPFQNLSTVFKSLTEQWVVLILQRDN